ncbi:hypothetical protein JCM9279_000703 [Rhodotorula babjevae]
MSAAPQAPTPAPLDTAQLATLLPAVVRLSHLASSSSSSPAPDPSNPQAEPDAHHPDPKLELSRQAAALHATLQALDAQAARVPNAHLSVDDQQWLVHQLGLECDRRRDQLAHVARLTQLDLAPPAPTASTGHVKAASSPPQAQGDADMADVA